MQRTSTRHDSMDGNNGDVPIACSLTAAGRHEQSLRWERLATRALTLRAQTARGLRLSFRREPGVEEELRQLVAVETECCPWAVWDLQAQAGHLVLDVSSAATGIDTLHGMFADLNPV